MQHTLASRHMSQHSKLQLPVIAHHKAVSGFAAECFAYSVPVFLKCRLVLQVGSGSGEAPGLCADV
eukprot:CAMPEP_0197848976 /NCGR_PEP_ID=MMETSP1438-20131217/10574_1 /TAXON_ID=1461541 /ORGANISM="Pterosperma sp., Strain CCMP1384" /LENGTH=65 /DNA_ID=CAMNT_0043461463 /DNA_START=824 /DNA_END=1018 /DNA_ORIENTATION=-